MKRPGPGKGRTFRFEARVSTSPLFGWTVIASDQDTARKVIQPTVLKLGGFFKGLQVHPLHRDHSFRAQIVRKVNAIAA